ncbi:hypothetical protein [Marinobacterium aestuariivivens]|uniref:Uncharacterized protein n=1 Tax=Marinobacterium aestuariivivens TaxID=1698799 RepID=A0ABW2A8C7_9GAMM
MMEIAATAMEAALKQGLALVLVPPSMKPDICWMSSISTAPW